MYKIEKLIKENDRVFLLHRECDLKVEPIKEKLLQDKVIKVGKYTIPFEDVAIIAPNLESSLLFDKQRYNGYDIYNIFTRNDLGKLEQFKYALAVNGEATGEHKHLEMTSKVEYMDNDDILEALGFEVEEPMPITDRITKIINRGK